MNYIEYKDRRLSRIALGTDHYGESITESDAFSFMDYYVEHGGNSFDCAAMYSQSDDDMPSMSHRTVGRWLKANSRESIFITSKGCFPKRSDKSISRITEKDLSSDLSRTLEDLSTDRLDMWLFHRDNPDMPASEIIDMANSLVIDKGLSGGIGASNWSLDRIQEANDWARKNNKVPFTFSEIQWSLAECTPQKWGDPTLVCMTEEEEKRYQDSGLILMSYASQAKGYFQKLAAGQELNEKVRTRFDSPLNRKRYERLVRLSNKYNVNISTLITSFITSRKYGSISIIGCTRISQLKNTLENTDLVLTDEDLAFLEA